MGCNLDELSQKTLQDGKVLSIGFYFPKYMLEHWNSSWSQILLKAKRNDAWIIMVLAEILAKHFACWLLRTKQYVLTNVPGRNTQILAQTTCSNLGNPKWVHFDNLLAENRRRKSQHRCKTTWQRTENAHDRYDVAKPDKIKGQNIIVFDDIVTTGATMRECADVLKSAGAKGVMGIALARTDRIKAPSFAADETSWSGGQAA